VWRYSCRGKNLFGKWSGDKLQVGEFAVGVDLGVGGIYDRGGKN